MRIHDFLLSGKVTRIIATRSEAVAATADARVEPLLDLAPLVVLKAGAAGASAHLRGGRVPVEVRARAVPVADTTGAGPSSTIVSAATRSSSFGNLRPGATYALSVGAINAAGDGPTVSGNITMSAALPATDRRLPQE